MRQGRIHGMTNAALAIGILLGSIASPSVHTAVAASSETKSAKAANGLHQFTGVVTALDKTTLTVEKRGKKARTVVFTRHAEMKSTGEVEKNARVTVYYRDEGGRSIAHRVVVKSDRPHAAGGGS